MTTIPQDLTLGYRIVHTTDIPTTEGDGLRVLIPITTPRFNGTEWVRRRKATPSEPVRHLNEFITQWADIRLPTAARCIFVKADPYLALDYDGNHSSGGHITWTRFIDYLQARWPHDAIEATNVGGANDHRYGVLMPRHRPDGTRPLITALLNTMDDGADCECDTHAAIFDTCRDALESLTDAPTTVTV